MLVWDKCSHCARIAKSRSAYQTRLNIRQLHLILMYNIPPAAAITMYIMVKNECLKIIYVLHVLL